MVVWDLGPHREAFLAAIQNHVVKPIPNLSKTLDPHVNVCMYSSLFPFLLSLGIGGLPLPFSPSFGVLWFDLVLANQYRLLAPNFLPRANKKTISHRAWPCMHPGTAVLQASPPRRDARPRATRRRGSQRRKSWTAYISLSMKSVDPSYNTRLLSAFVLSL